MGRFTSKSVIVTGGSQGIGKATCQLFAQEGARVAIADINRERGKELENQLCSQGCIAKFIYADTSNETSIQDMVNQVVELFSTIDILVNCAASFIIKGLEATVDEWKEMLMTNVVGYALCSKYCANEMRKTGKGAIINIASISGFVAQPGYLTYNTTKAAVVNMTRCLAQDLAQYNIRVNNVCPGTVWTENNAYYTGLKYGVDRAGADQHPEIGGLNMLKRVADPEEIAKAILFLASDDASFITAENLMVDGGYTAQ